MTVPTSESELSRAAAGKNDCCLIASLRQIRRNQLQLEVQALYVGHKPMAL